MKIADRQDRQVKKKSATRLIILAGLWALVGLAAWEITIRTAATALSATDTTSALRWDPSAPSILADAADRRLTDARTAKDLDQVKVLAGRALTASPLTESALRQLGLAADLRGDSATASRIMTLAGRASPFDAVSQVWLFNASLHNGDFTDAATRVDILFRTRPDLVEPLLSSIESMVLTDGGRTALVAVLQDNPPWRTRLLTTLASSADPTVAYSVLATLSSKTAVSDDEIRPLVDRLVAAGNFQLGYLTWLQLAPDRAGNRLLSNGDFKRQPSEIPFDWVLTPISGAYTEVVPSDDPSHGNALHVDFAHTRVRYANTEKLVLLKPGAYRFGGRVRVQDLVAERGVGWKIQCAEGAKQILANSPDFSGTSTWHEFDVQFTVPDDSCSAQWLILQNLADLAVQLDIGGDIWFSQLAIDHGPDPDSRG